MGDKSTAASTRAARSSGEWNAKSSKDAPPRRRTQKQQRVSDSEEEEAEQDEEEEEEEEEDEEEQEEEEEEEADDSETGSESEREQRRKKAPKLTTRKPSPAKKAKDDDKRKIKTEKPPPSGSVGRRRSANAAASKEYAGDDGSETTSQGATDDEMNGRGGAEAAKATAGGATATNANDTGNADRERDRERDAGGDRERGRGRGDRDRERESDRYDEREPERERERNASMTLPSLSRAAMMHMGRGGREGGEMSGSGSHPDRRGADDVPSTNYSADTSNRSTGWRRDRSRSRSRERPDPRDGNRRNQSNQPKENGRGGADDDTPNYSGDGGRGGGQRDDDPASPGQDGQDVRIMFHGREIYADDLIGLRVAKTFVGHGRFLGQVVKFDEPTSLYTVVYADGDAEELSIENTIQILIQDEIERADPSVPPVPAAFRNDRIPDSPEAGSVTPASSTATVSVPVAPLNPSAIPPPQTQQSSQQQQQQPPVYPSRRSAMPFTEREAQFLMGMFENNALPVLLRQGWRVQSNAAGTEQRFYAPPGNFRGAGHVFVSAFDVVELIVFDNEMLTACFPQNMHSVILSLFPESSSGASTAASRKRGSPAVPTDGPTDAYDSKRVRGAGRDGVYATGSGVGVRAGGAGGSMGMLPSRNDERLVPPVSYRPEERERVERGDHDGYGVPQRVASHDRFPANGPSRGEPSEGYRRTGSADYRSMPLRPLGADGAPGPSSSRWAGPPHGGAGSDPSEYHHRRSFGDAPEWHDRDPLASRNGPAPPSAGGYMGAGRPSSGGGLRPEEPNRGGGVYYNERGVPRGGSRMGRPGGPAVGPSGAGGAVEPVSSYGRYRDSRGAPPSGGQYSPGPESFSNRYPPSRGELSAPDYRGPSPGSVPPQGMADRFPRPVSRGSSGNGAPPGSGGSGGAGSGGRGFSMMDVDRNTSGGSGGYDHHRMERGRSPHEIGGGPASGSSGSYGGPPSHMQHYGHHQRSASNGSMPNPADESRNI